MSLSGEAVLYASSPGDKKAQESAKLERRRRKIVKELFETERTYLFHLELVNKFFDFPLRFACLVPDEIHSRLFSNLEQIQDVNSTLLVQMEESSIGQAFSKLGPFLKLYSTYANNHQYALTTLQEWQSKSQEFANFVERQESRSEVGGLKLNALLITPVQRVPRYKMLLGELLQCTPEDHYDYEKLKEASDKVTDIALHINEYIRQNENFMKMLAIQRSFDNSVPKLLVPGREFLKEGPLKKVSRKGCRSYERMFFLFSDILLYGKPRLLDGGGKSYTCSCVLPLKHCSVEPVFITNLNKTDTGGVFKVTCKEESLVLYSEDQGCAKDWSTAVEKAIRKLRNERQTLRRPSSNKVPLRGRSLRRHRLQQEKADPKMSEKTPHRPLSIISVESEDSISNSETDGKGRPNPAKRLIKRAFSSSQNIMSFQEGPEEERHQMFKPSTSQGEEDLSREESVSLSDNSDSLSNSTRNLVAVHSLSENDDANQGSVSNECYGRLERENQQSTASYESLTTNAVSSDNVSHWPNAISISEEAENCEPHKDRPLPESSASTSTAYFPPNSPAHKYFQRQSWNMKLRSYIQRPLKRFQKVKREISNPCSPFRSKALSRRTSHRKSPI